MVAGAILEDNALVVQSIVLPQLEVVIGQEPEMGIVLELLHLVLNLRELVHVY